MTLNDEALVTLLLDLGTSLSTQDLQGKTPLMTACEYGHLQAIESLATRGMNLAGDCTCRSSDRDMKGLGVVIERMIV